MLKKFLLLAALTLSLATLVFLGLRWYADRVACTPLRVLFIGNSYTFTYDMPAMLAELAADSQPRRCLRSEVVAVGGAGLNDHWAQGQALARIRAESWDYVVLQERSRPEGTRPLLAPNDLYTHARLFDNEIRRQGARTLLFVTWARKREPQNQQAITAAYAKIAGERGAQMAPVGSAWHNLQATHPEIALYDPDESHPTPTGAYLTACVFYATLFGASPVGLDVPEGVDAAQAPLIQQAAWAAVSPQLRR